MSEVKGINVLFKVAPSGSPSNYQDIEGQTSAQFNGDTGMADTTAKDNSGWRTATATVRSGVVTVSGNLRTSGNRDIYDECYNAWKAGNTVAGRIHFDGSTYLEGDFFVSYSLDGETEDVAKYTFTFTPQDALTANP